MERLTEWTGEQWIARTKRLNGKIVGDKDIYNKLAEYENADERLQKHFGANITLIDMLNHFVACMEDKQFIGGI